jgi:hypothetical protein
VSNIAPFDNGYPTVCREGSQNAPATTLWSAIEDLMNGLDKTATAVNQAYAARLKQETAMEIGYVDSIFGNRAGENC